MTITHANIEFNENGTPYATQFEDVYFSDAKGVDESTYVFLLNNHLLDRWQNWHAKRFVIAETGFGTGLNFLLTLDFFSKYLEKKQENAKGSRFHLHFISIEKYPISADDLIKALSIYPELTTYADQLINQYPLAIKGCHRLSFMNNQATLDLWLGDVHEVLPSIENTPSGIVDSWYLDGFAPSKNPEMWTQVLFEQMARLSKHDCHLATFTAAGHVRRGLISAGFDVNKHPGHGRKREMLAGSIAKTTANPIRLPYFSRHHHQAKSSTPQIAIVGGGLAAANCAYALGLRGYDSTTIYCKDPALAQGASGNPQGGFYPQLNADAGYASQIHSLAFSYAVRVYRQLLRQGQDFNHQWCGVMQVAFNPNVAARYKKMMDNQTWSDSLIHWLEAEQASQIAGVQLPYPGMFIPDGGWINPPELTQALINHSKAEVKTSKHLVDLNYHNNQWHMSWPDGKTDVADVVILALGSELVDCTHTAQLPFRLVRGQVEAIPSQGELTKLSTVLCHKGYLTPAQNGKHAMGSTYIKNDRETAFRSTEQNANLAMQKKALVNCRWIKQVEGRGDGRAAIRCSTADHLPMVGAVPNITEQTNQFKALYKALPAERYPQASDHPNLYLLGGLGSRGLTTAPLCAEILASQIFNEPLPLASKLLDSLNPNRFLIKGLIRREI